MSARWAARWARVVVAAMLPVVAALAGCSHTVAARISYVVDGALPTYNVNTTIGAASGGAQAFARTLAGFAYLGPDGQVVPDHDFGTVSVVSSAPLVLDYVIAADAVYSDGKPITCDDLVLTWAASSGRFPGFDAASRAGYSDISSIDCQRGQKKARVSFAPDRAIADYAQLFGATSLMPSHVIADELGIDVTDALLSNAVPKVEQIAAVWNSSWDLKAGIETAHFPASGPYKIESVDDSGAVVLVANERWWGAKPLTKRIIVSTQGPDIQDQVNARTVDVLDAAVGSFGALTVPDNYRHTDYPSAGLEQLIFAGTGPLAEPRARRALALCVPRDVIARDAGVPIANSRLAPATDDAVAAADGRVQAEPFTRADQDAARREKGADPLSVRIGYRGPNARLATTIGTIRGSCAAAGITVSDVVLDSAGPQDVRDGKVDALLASTGGATGSGSTGASALDAYTLHSGNGNNLSGYANAAVDKAIGDLAVVTDPAERVRLLGETAPILWADLPTLPLYRQQRRLLFSPKTSSVTPNPTRWGAGWNMDRWSRSE